jgi:hypothetical protein
MFVRFGKGTPTPSCSVEVCVERGPPQRLAQLQGTLWSCSVAIRYTTELFGLGVDACFANP